MKNLFQIIHFKQREFDVYNVCTSSNVLPSTDILIELLNINFNFEDNDRIDIQGPVNMPEGIINLDNLVTK